ncbi:hypothetical protein BJ875DRAFT_465899 [Amylocarpus encephaloides]|uniref:ER-bound oxygenase mpaB/mpaB'/Rubber oxygenase catalytic domain-containing protein n=1 Tax=Amylocarpus encephaloides TaxID=45428 RepID=A0A9P7YFH0_9HELO|nr:hypothetical protein BJ875DRAFT_465899 [Amylocarpus encephaloides]
MAKSNPLYRERWGYGFDLTTDHLSTEEISKLRAQYDSLGSEVLGILQKIVANKDPAANGAPKADLYSVLRDNYQDNEVLSKFWDELHVTPEWVDWAQIERGQKFFGRYALGNATAFALQGFVRENSASPGIAEVFARTGGFAVRNLLSRVIETFTWVVHVTTSLESIQPGGEGHTSTIRVRLLHASVRQRITRLVESRPQYFDIKKHGSPVNDLDSMHAIALFCCMPMWDSLPKMGVYPTKQEITDFIALFRYISYLTGTPTSYWTTPKKAKAVMETMFLHELDPTNTSKILAYNFITWLSNAPPVYLSRDFLEAGCRWMNGHEMSDALGMGRPNLIYYLVFQGHNVVVFTLAYLQRFIPAFDRFMININRKLLYAAVTDHRHLVGGAGLFDFKFVPQLDRKFGKDSGEIDAQGHSRWWRPVEAVFLMALMIAGLVGCIMVAFVFKFALKLHIKE